MKLGYGLKDANFLSFIIKDNISKFAIWKMKRYYLHRN
jgi:hypothetical protein